MASNRDERRVMQGMEIVERDVVEESAEEVMGGGGPTGHARDDALSTRQFERLVSATHSVGDPGVGSECRAAVFLAGRLGMRKGEIAHMGSGWVDFASGTITIPEHDPCTKGKREGEVCGYCRRRAEDRAETHSLSDGEAVEAILDHLGDAADAAAPAEVERMARSLQGEVCVAAEEAADMQWRPKTKKSARTIPFDFDVRAEMALEDFFDRYSGWERSASTLNRRINRLADEAGLDARVYPHSLRATAASYHASRDISVHSLMSIMGWQDPSTARTYVNANPDSAAREIRSKHR
jgi:integrase